MTHCAHEFSSWFDGVERCTLCGLGHTTRIQVPENAQNYLDMNPAEVPKRTRYFERLFDRFAHQYSLPARSLDVGCSLGLLVRVFRQRGWEAEGIDSYEGFRPDPDAGLFRATLDTFNPTQGYDLITMIHVLEHMRAPVVTLQRIRRLLNPGGACLIVVPHFGGAWARRMGEEWPWLNLNHHVYHYSRDALIGDVESAGLRPERLETYSGYSAPSIPQVALAQSHFFEQGWGSRQPLRSLLFRANTLLNPPLNWLLDQMGQGAELHLLAKVG